MPGSTVAATDVTSADPKVAAAAPSTQAVHREVEVAGGVQPAAEKKQVTEVLQHLEELSKEEKRTREQTGIREMILPHEMIPVPADLEQHMQSVPQIPAPDIMPYIISMNAVPITREQVQAGSKLSPKEALRWFVEKCKYVLKMAHKHMHGRKLQPIDV